MDLGILMKSKIPYQCTSQFQLVKDCVFRDHDVRVSRKKLMTVELKKTTQPKNMLEVQKLCRHLA